MSRKSKIPRVHNSALQTDNQDFDLLPDRYQSYDKLKNTSLDVSQIYKQSSEHERQGERVENCANSLTFEVNEKGYRLCYSQFCRVRLCPVCQWRRSLMWRAKFYNGLDNLIEQTPNSRWLFLTLTVRNCEVHELRQTLEQMSAAWKKLLLRKEFKDVLGWTRTIEVTRNDKDNTAHPHYHVVLLVKSTYFKGNHYVSQQQWTDVWQSVLKVNYKPIVNIKAVKRRSNAQQNENSTTVTTIKELVKYVLKYAVKPSDMIANDDWFLEVSKQLFKLRFIASGGLLKEIFKNIDYQKDDITDDTAKFNFNIDLKRYKLTDK